MKIRNGFVSNSSSSAFILSSSIHNELVSTHYRNLAMAFSEVKIKENGNLQIKYNGPRSIVENVLNEMGIFSYLVRWTNVE